MYLTLFNFYFVLNLPSGFPSGEPSVIDLCRVARVPFSFNMKDPENKFKTRPVGEINPKRYKLDDIKKALGIDLGSKGGESLP